MAERFADWSIALFDLNIKSKSNYRKLNYFWSILWNEIVVRNFQQDRDVIWTSKFFRELKNYDANEIRDLL